MGEQEPQFDQTAEINSKFLDKIVESLKDNPEYNKVFMRLLCVAIADKAFPEHRSAEDVSPPAMLILKQELLDQNFQTIDEAKSYCKENNIRFPSPQNIKICKSVAANRFFKK